MSMAVTSSVVAPRKQPRTTQDIYREDLRDRALESKMKPEEEKTWQDRLNIALYEIEKLTQHPPVLHACENCNVNYMA